MKLTVPTICRHIIDDIQIGKCQGCSQTIYDDDFYQLTQEQRKKIASIWYDKAKNLNCLNIHEGKT